MVDKSRGEKLVVNIDIDFPRVPCYSEHSVLVNPTPWPPILTSYPACQQC